MFNDIRFSIRLFRRFAGPVLVALFGLSVAIGTVAATFGLFDAVFLRDFAMSDPASVVIIAPAGEPAWSTLPYSDFVQLKAGASGASIEAVRSERLPIGLTAVPDEPDRSVQFVTAGYLSMLGAQTVTGRQLTTADGSPDAPVVAVLSEYYWDSQLHRDPAVTGMRIHIGQLTASVVGVVSSGFTGPTRDVQAAWLPLSHYNEAFAALSESAYPSTTTVGRLTPTLTPEALEANLNVVFQRDRRVAERAVRLHVFSAASPRSLDDREAQATALAILGALLLLLVLACSNVATLLTAGSIARSGEIALRLALGAPARRVVRQMATESVMLGLGAAVLGTMVAGWSMPLLARLIELPLGAAPRLDARILIVSGVAGILSSLVSGVAAARYAYKPWLLLTLQHSAGNRSGGMPRLFRTSVVACQGAGSVILLVVAGLLTRAALARAAIQVGMNADHLVVVSFAPPIGFDTRSFVSLAEGHLLPLAGPAGVSKVYNAPFGANTEHLRVRSTESSVRLLATRADAAYARVAGLPIVKGRWFTQAEVDVETPVALVSASAARALFKSDDVVGRVISVTNGRSGDHDERLIGVVADGLLEKLQANSAGAVYLPIASVTDRAPALAISADVPAVASKRVGEALRRIDPRVKVTTELPGAAVQHFAASSYELVSFVGPIALVFSVISVLGTYGLVSYVVSQRTAEISTRLALGASPGSIAAMLLLDVSRPLGIGVMLGLGVSAVFAIGLSRALAIDAFDVATYGGVVLLVATGALGSVCLPIYRASTLAPATVMRLP